MLVWVGVIRYLGFFKKYNVRTNIRNELNLTAMFHQRHSKDLFFE